MDETETVDGAPGTRKTCETDASIVKCVSEGVNTRGKSRTRVLSTAIEREEERRHQKEGVEKPSRRNKGLELEEKRCREAPLNPRERRILRGRGEWEDA